MFSIKKITNTFLIAIVALCALPAFVSSAEAKVVVNTNNLGKAGTISGIVKDEAGKPIAGAFVAIFRVGTSDLLKKVRSAANGSFFAKIIPGTYTILAVAEGYNPIRLGSVEVDQAENFNYGFKLERSGSGNTLPEKRADRKNPKYIIRAQNGRRSIYQNSEGDLPIDETIADENVTDDSVIAENNSDERNSARPGQTIVETYFADTKGGSFTGVNVAMFLPINEKAEVVIAGQAGIGENAPARLETKLTFRPNDKHQIRLNTGVANFGKVVVGKDQDKSLGQFSIQATDEWKVREGVIIVVGVDYSRFFGAGNDFSISPRLGFQYDVNSKTRFRTAYTTQTEKTTWQNVIDMEGTQVLFREPTTYQDVAVIDEKPQMNRSTRLEFSIERILDKNSTIEGNVFFDTVSSNGVGLLNLPINSLNSEGFNEFVANQQGKARGVRVVYNRRLNSTFNTSAGYSFGNGQKLSENGITNPADTFEEDYFQTVFAQVDADFKTGTSVRTIFRFSPEATIFAIDPFQGRLAIYDPGLSILVTQSLPNLGLPFHAEAIVDARNILGFQNSVNNDENSLSFTSQRRILRGGILVRF